MEKKKLDLSGLRVEVKVPAKSVSLSNASGATPSFTPGSASSGSWNQSPYPLTPGSAFMSPGGYYDAFESTPAPHLQSAISESDNIDYSILDSAGVAARQEEELSKICSVFELPMPAARILARSYKWNIEKLVNECIERGQDEVLAKAGILRDDLKTEIKLDPSVEHMCMICCYEFPASDFFSVCPDHYYCKNCWDTYLSGEIADGAARRLVCMGCKTAVDESAVAKFVTDKVVAQKYMSSVINSYVEDNAYVKWCPSVPNCGRAIAARHPNSCFAVHCDCGISFCFTCLVSNRTLDTLPESHTPTTCLMMKEWRKLDGEFSLTAKWLADNTKDCPSCGKPIEKNGGCQHMTCRSCHHEFCWLCMRRWTGGCSCNGLSLDKDGKSAQRISLERHLFYFEHSKAHWEARRLEGVTLEKIRRKIQEVCDLNPGLLPSEFKWIEKAAGKLFECRTILQYTYVFAYFLFSKEVPSSLLHNLPRKFAIEDRKKARRMFEDHQRELEGCTERLSGWLEKDMEDMVKSQSEVMTAADLADRRLYALYDLIRAELVPEWDYGTAVPAFNSGLHLFTAPKMKGLSHLAPAAVPSSPVSSSAAAASSSSSSSVSPPAPSAAAAASSSSSNEPAVPSPAAAAAAAASSSAAVVAPPTPIAAEKAPAASVAKTPEAVRKRVEEELARLRLARGE